MKKNKIEEKEIEIADEKSTKCTICHGIGRVSSTPIASISCDHCLGTGVEPKKV